MKAWGYWNPCECGCGGRHMAFAFETEHKALKEAQADRRRYREEHAQAPVRDEEGAYYWQPFRIESVKIGALVDWSTVGYQIDEELSNGALGAAYADYENQMVPDLLPAQEKHLSKALEKAAAECGWHPAAWLPEESSEESP